jgi:hypothetical protein
MWIPLAVVMGFLLTLGAAVWMTADLPVAARMLPQELAAARAAGVALDPADLRPNPPIPKDQNAGPLYTKIADRWLRSGPGRDVITRTRRPEATAADYAALRRALPTFDGYAKELKEAAARPRCYFNRPWERGDEVLFRESVMGSSISKLFVARAERAADAMDSGAAWEELGTSARIARHFSDQPTLIDANVGIACQALTVRGAALLLSKLPPTPANLDRARALLALIGGPPDPRKGYRGMTVMERQTVQSIRVGRKTMSYGGYFPSEFDNPLMRSSLARDAVEARLISYRRRALALLPSTVTDWRASHDALSRLSANEKAQKGDSRILSRYLSDFPAQIAMMLPKWEANRRLLATAIRLLDARRATGKFPSVLPSGDEAIDPFTDKPFGYRTVPGGFVLWSIGADLTNDFGAKRAKMNQLKGYDIVFEYPDRRP